MKKTDLIHSEISYVISKMGHTDGLTIGDSGLPIPKEVQRIDLALRKGIPSFLETLDTVLTELCIEEIVLATEMEEKNKSLYEKVIKRIKNLELKNGIAIRIKKVDHEIFKEMTKTTKCVIRTGEHTPYANIILKSGVVF